MKEMVYSAERKVEILDTGFCFGLLYYILSLGTHPTAYIKIPKDHKLYGKSCSDIYKEIDIYVHGGLTYSENDLWLNENEKIEGWFIGWDYSHCGDYMGYYELVPETIRLGKKKWTTQEILQELREACYQIKEAEQSVDNKSK